MCIRPWGGGYKGWNCEAAGDSVTPGPMLLRNTVQALYISSAESLGFSRMKPKPLSKAGALLSDKVSCDLPVPVRSMLLLFSLVMSITVMCRDLCPSVGRSMHSTVQGCYSKRYSRLFSGGFCSASPPARWVPSVSGSG